MTTPLSRFEENPTLDGNDSLHFACRGCGDQCCTTSSSILIAPPQAWRIQWSLLRRKRQIGMGTWLDIAIGSNSGLPAAQLVKVHNGFDQPACVFMTRLKKEGKPTGFTGCGIHDARPITCRLFPVGRLTAFDKDEDGGAVTTRYVLADMCPGFESPTPTDSIPEWYRLPNNQTVAEWVAAQVPAELDVETNAVVEIYKWMLEEGYAARTPNNPQQRLHPALAQTLWLPIFYSPPPLPTDPDDDHATVLQHLTRVRQMVTEVMAYLDQNRLLPSKLAGMPRLTGMLPKQIAALKAYQLS